MPLLPFTNLREPPSLPSAGRLARRWWSWWLLLALGVGAAVAVAGMASGWAPGGAPASVLAWLPAGWPPAPWQQPEAASATLHVESVPPGASIDVDGRARGQTPADVALAAGAHRLTLRRAGYADLSARVRLEAGHTSSFRAELWLRAPQVQRLRPAFPGARIAAAQFLADGSVALTVALPPADERQLWVVDGRGGARRLGPPLARGGMALAPDGQAIAYVASGQGSGRLDEVWLTDGAGERGARRYALTGNSQGGPGGPPGRLPGGGDERLLELSWSPDGRQLLLMSQQQLAGGGQRTRFRRLPVHAAAQDASAAEAAQELLSLPSAVVPASSSWSPAGDRLALLAQAGQLTSLCLLGPDDGEFRYLADLSRDGATPQAFPPLAWSPDGQQLLYAALSAAPKGPTMAGWLFGSSKPRTEWFATDADRPLGQAVGVASGWPLSWQPDGSWLALDQPKPGGPLVLRVVEPGGQSRDLAEVPISPGGAFAARWDAAHAQAVVVVAGSGTAQPEYWLVRFHPEAPE